MKFLYLIQSTPWLFYSVAGLVALLVGSFLNVVIHRLPRMMQHEWRLECRRLLEGEDVVDDSLVYNLVLPGSRCPHCDHRISALENIPVLSYIWLRGKCRDCGQRISLRYPLVEIATCLLTLAVAAHFGPSLQTVFAILLTWSLIALALIDYDHQLLPDSITLPMLWLGILCNMQGLYTDTHSSIYGAVAGYLILWSVFMGFKLLTGKEGMGYGDFKLLAMLGAWMGWQALPAIIIISSLLGSVIGVSLIVFGGHDRNRPIPFGPYLVIGGWVALLYGRRLTEMYVNWAVN